MGATDKEKQKLKTEVNKQVGKTITTLRKNKNITLHKLAGDLTYEVNKLYPKYEIALDDKSIFNYEQGTALPYYLITAYARYFCVSTDYILGNISQDNANKKNEVLLILENLIDIFKNM